MTPVPKAIAADLLQILAELRGDASEIRTYDELGTSEIEEYATKMESAAEQLDTLRLKVIGVIP